MTCRVDPQPHLKLPLCDEVDGENGPGEGMDRFSTLRGGSGYWVSLRLPGVEGVNAGSPGSVGVTLVDDLFGRLS